MRFASNGSLSEIPFAYAILDKSSTVEEHSLDAGISVVIPYTVSVEEYLNLFEEKSDFRQSDQRLNDIYVELKQMSKEDYPSKVVAIGAVNFECWSTRTYIFVSAIPVGMVVMKGKVDIDIKNYSNVTTANTQIDFGYLVPLVPGLKSWNKAITNSVNETITAKFTLTNEYGQNPSSKTESHQRYLFEGGGYNPMQAYGGQRHHMPSQAGYNQGGTQALSNAPVIRMLTVDHQKTASYGNVNPNFKVQEGNLIRQGMYLAAFDLSVADIRSKFGSKYDEAINEARLFAQQDHGWTR